MKFHALLILLALFTAQTWAKPHIATIDSLKIAREYDAIKTELASFEKRKNTLENDPRKKTYDALATQIREQTEQIQKLDLKDENRPFLLKDLEKARSEFLDIRSRWGQFRSEKLREMTDDYVVKLEALNQKIIDRAREIAEQKEFDWLLETGGRTSTKLPVVLYLRESTDLTDEVLSILNQEYQAANSPEPNPNQ